MGENMGQKELRFYEKEGQQYVSVTTVTGIPMKYALLLWYGKHGIVKAKELSEEALSIGSAVHKWIDNDIRTNLYEEPSAKIKRAIDNYEIFSSTYRPVPELTEQVVYHPTCGYAGTFDGLFKIEGKPVLLDWKTSSSMYDEYRLQLEAYYRAGLATGLLPKSTELWVVRLDKEEEIDVDKDIYRFKPNKTVFKAFLHLLGYFKTMEKVTELIKKEKKQCA
jgi:hypothetical protein